MRTLKAALSALATSCPLIIASLEATAAYPDKPVHFIVGTAPGGGVDFIARIIAKGLSDKWGQQVIVDNRPGASETLGSDIVAHAAPDGYTFDVTSSAVVITPSQIPLNYDPIKNFTPVSQLTNEVDPLIAKASLPMNSIKDIVQYAKANPGKLNVGVSGVGSTAALEVAILKKLAQIEFSQVAYTGSGPALVGVLSGEVDLANVGIATAVEQVKAGKIKVLAVSSKGRVPIMPNVPTFAEAGNEAGFDGNAFLKYGHWDGLLAPAGTPKEIVNKVHHDVEAVMNAPDIKKIILENGVIIVASPPDVFAQTMKDEFAQWSAFMKEFTAK